MPVLDEVLRIAVDNGCHRCVRYRNFQGIGWLPEHGISCTEGEHPEIVGPAGKVVMLEIDLEILVHGDRSFGNKPVGVLPVRLIVGIISG